MTRIVLCGFMGCGKSTVGRELAARLGYGFVDTDALVEAQYGGPVRDCFAAEGEAGFRRREAEVCRALAGRERLVIAAGGGTVLQPDALAALRPGALLLYLSVAPETVLRRLRGDSTRPLLQTADPAATVRALLAARDPLYRAAADAVLEADGPAADVAERAFRLICEKSAQTIASPFPV